jgi:hypothetical protein
MDRIGSAGVARIGEAGPGREWIGGERIGSAGTGVERKGSDRIGWHGLDWRG